MGRVLTNNTGLQYAIELTETDTNLIGVLAGEQSQPGTPTWRTLEPNSFGAIGPSISTVARDPISGNRQRRKGTITDLDSSADFEADLTLAHFEDFAEAAVFATFIGSEVYSPSATDADSYTVTAGSALSEGTLVYARGFSNPANNGLKEVDSGSTTTDIVVTDTLTVEASAPTNAVVEVAGFRTAAGDLAVTDVSGAQITITSTAGIFDDPGLGLVAGAAVYIGGENAINRFSDTANRGYARVVSVNAAALVVDNADGTWVTEAAAAQEVDIYVGQFLRNVPTSDASFLERSFQFEVAYPNLGSGGSDGYEYSKGNYCNTLAFNIPLTDKATFTPNFVGIDTDPITTTRKANGGTPISPLKTTAFNTTQDCARLRVTQADETGLTTDFKSITLNINNNVAPEKVLCVLGARFMNYGNLEVSVEAQVLFTNEGVTSAIRNNETVRMNFSLENDDGSIYVDIPSMTLGDGSKDFPVNETVTINLTGESFQDDVLGTSIGITKFAFTPTIT